MKVVYGDLIDMALEGHFDVIVHGCNCFCVMGAGVAKQIKETFRSAYNEDLKTVKGDGSKLGSYSAVEIDQGRIKFTVVNGYTQYNYKGWGPQVDYYAIRSLFRKIKQDFTGKRIGYPKIGAGLAGGDWEIISSIIDEELDGENHTVVLL